MAVLREADACKQPGEVGALLRREGLYSSHLSEWRKQRDQGMLNTKCGRRPGSRAEAALTRSPLSMAGSARVYPTVLQQHPHSVAQLLRVPASSHHCSIHKEQRLPGFPRRFRHWGDNLTTVTKERQRGDHRTVTESVR